MHQPFIETGSLTSAPCWVDDVLILVAAVGCGLLSGIYFIFSFCVMWSLDRSQPQVAIQIMNKINVVIINAWFFAVFFGTPLICFVILFRKEVWKNRSIAIAAAVLLLLGEYGVTMVFNVPMNKSLATHIDSDVGLMGDSVAKAIWTEYSCPWTFWNTVRCLASTAATAGFAWALRPQKCDFPEVNL